MVANVRPMSRVPARTSAGRYLVEFVLTRRAPHLADRRRRTRPVGAERRGVSRVGRDLSGRPGHPYVGRFAEALGLHFARTVAGGARFPDCRPVRRSLASCRHRAAVGDSGLRAVDRAGCRAGRASSWPSACSRACSAGYSWRSSSSHTNSFSSSAITLRSPEHAHRQEEAGAAGAGVATGTLAWRLRLAPGEARSAVGRRRRRDAEPRGRARPCRQS